jgi:acylpyruvate hydrolase
MFLPTLHAWQETSVVRRKGDVSMKFVTIDVVSDGHAGVLVGDNEVLDLTAHGQRDTLACWLPRTVRGILEAGDEGLAVARRVARGIEYVSAAERDRLREMRILRPYRETPLLAPIPNPRLILSVGMNYQHHLDEMRSVPRPRYPSSFIKALETLTGTAKPIVLPAQCSDMVDFEGELTVVIGRTCYNVSEDEAIKCVAGYTIANDVSARNWASPFFASENKFEAINTWSRNLMGKNLPTFMPCGPVLATSDEVGDPHELQLTTSLNGEVMQSTKTDDLIFKIPQIVSYFSKWYRLLPGDLITTGSPSGVGFGRNPKIFMKPGDVVDIEIERIGKLSNTVVGAVEL